MRPRRGNGHKFTQEVAGKILGALRAGNFLETAAAYAGIDSDTIRRWAKAGARGKDAELASFAREIDQARAAAEVRDVAIIAKAAESEWTAAAWRLERRAPERWGRRDRMQVTAHVGGTVALKWDEGPDARD